jgi:hypothetical protein
MTVADEPDAGNLQELFDAIEALLIRYIVFRCLEQRTAVVLWVAHTHALEAADATPYLYVRSPERRCGKTRLLEVLVGLVPRPELSTQLTEAVLFRLIEEGPPTLLIDEVDAVFKGPTTERTEALRALLNAGYRRGLMVPRCVGTGTKMKVKRFRTFCPKILAGIANTRLPSTVADRCIPIDLPRRKKSEHVSKHKPRKYVAEVAGIRKAFADWAVAAVHVLSDAEPEIPDLDNDRAEEVWEPLIAIADRAGGEWPARAREAALALGGGEPDTESVGDLLLRAIFEMFEETGEDKRLTITILRGLVEREGEPWGGWWGREVDAAEDGTTPRKPAMDLARHLKLHNVIPKEVRTSEGKGKGYDRADFTDAFERFLPSLATKGRDNATSHAAQEDEAPRPAPDDFRVATPETTGAQGLSRCRDLGPEGRGNNGCGPSVFDLAKAAEFPSLEIRKGMRVVAGREAWLKFLTGAIRDDVEAARRALEQGAGIP